MTKSDHERLPEDAKNSPPATAAWGTWEDLLLAYAVNRFGTGSWDSISFELKKRSSASIHLTPNHCEQKYGELKRRFSQSDDVVMEDGGDTTAAAIPWLEELRKLRVLELQRELQNYDLYISSLQSKVKMLTEESEKTGGDTKENSDLGHKNDEIESEKAVKPTNETLEVIVCGDEDSERDNQSVNGSNGNLETGVEKSVNENGESPVHIADEKPESPAVMTDGEEPVETEPGGEASESIAESKSEGKNSDVQSSAKKLRKMRDDWVPRGSIKMDDQDQSTDSIPVRSLPLVEFMQKLQKLGSVVFERRLDRQEKLSYENLIKQHIDYETLQSRLKEGYYSDGNDKFFRDLLLLVNNTRVFFPKQSPESIAAFDLQQFILHEMITKKKQKTHSKRPTDPSDSLLHKPKLTGSIAICRKRSSITAKAASGSSSGKKELSGLRNPEKLVEAKKKGKSPVNESSNTRPGKKTKLSEAEEKKQSAAKFLNRMKRSNEPLLSTLKSMPEPGTDTGTSTSNGVGGSGGDGKKDQPRKKSSSGRQVNHGRPTKRTVGRPPKRAATTPPLATVGGKRNREPVDSEEALGSKQKKKRSKR